MADAARRLLPGSTLKVPKVPALFLVVISVLTGWLLGSSTFSRREVSLDIGRSHAVHYGALVLILAAGVAIRFYGLEFGWPSNFHPDESGKVAGVLAMDALGNLDPGRFHHPSLLLYCTLLLSKILNLFGPLQGQSEMILLAGRAVSAMAGSGSMLLLYLLARRLRDRGSALMAVALFALAPLAVTCSRYLKEDSLLVAGVLLTVLLWVISVQERSRSWLLLAALAAGVAFSAKYTGLLLLSLFLVWPWIVSRKLRPDPRLLCWSAAALCLTAIAFLALTPFVLVNPAQAVGGFLFEARHAIGGHFSARYPVLLRIGPWSQWWMYHIGRSVIPGMGLAPALLGLVGVGILVRRRKPEDLVLVGLFLLFLLPAEMARSKPHPQPDRYILPVIPFLCIAASETLRRLSQMGSKKLLVGVVAVAIGSSVLRSVHLASDLMNDTRTRLPIWIPANLPEGSRIFLDYSRVYSGSVSGARGLSKYGALTRWREMRAKGFDYVVESSFGSGRFLEQPNVQQEIQSQLLELRGESELVKEFRAGSGPYGFHNPVLRLYRLPAR